MVETENAITYSGYDFFKKASSIASHYGFSPLERLLAGSSFVRLPQIIPLAERKDTLVGEFATVMRRCLEHKAHMGSEAILLYHSNIQNSRNPRRIVFSLQVLGVPESIAEALIIKTALAILGELGISDPCIHINSVGDRDSSLRLSRELSQFVRGHLSEIPTAIQHVVRDDVFAALEYLRRKKFLFDDSMPKSIEFLSRDSRRHFREVIEYLETVCVPYEIDHTLLGHRDWYSQTLFEIRSGGSDERRPLERTLVAKGARFDELSRRLYKTSFPGVGIVFSLEARRPLRQVAIKLPFPRKPKVFFVHLGFTARLHSLEIIDILRHSHVPFYQSLGTDRLTGQLERA